MLTPEYLKENDFIAISSQSDGIVKEKKVKSLEDSITLLKNRKYKVLEDAYTRNSRKGESAPSKKRAEELEKLIKNKDVKLICSVTGGNYLVEVLDDLNLDCISKEKKWFMGQSDTTILLFLLTTKYDMKTIYFYNAASLAQASKEELENNFKILQGEKIEQRDFHYYIDKENNKQESSWQNSKEINTTGRIIGGYLECLTDMIGTKYDVTVEFIEKYKEEGIIWYFDINYIDNEALLRSLWHLRNLGWFQYTKCILFGRGEEMSYTGISLNEAIERGLKDLDIPYITNCDFGHTSPRITIVNGAKVSVVCNNEEHVIKILD